MKSQLILILLSTMMAFGQTDLSTEKVTLDDVAESLAKTKAKAVDGDLESCLEIWRSGRFIDKHEILKNQCPPEKRLELLKFAAQKGNADANLKLFEYLSCDKKETFSETRKWLLTSHRNGNNQASVILALILSIDKKETRAALEVVKLAEDRISQEAEPNDEFAESKLSKEDFKRLRVVIQQGDAASLVKAIGPAETEFEKAIEVWRMGNRSPAIALTLVQGKRFVSRQGNKSGMDSDTEIAFGDNQKVSVVLSGVDSVRYEGTYSIDEKIGEIELILPKLDKPWPKMKVEAQNGRTLISRSDGQTSMTPELKDAKEFQNYWPFAEQNPAKAK
jgi:hypothetical protein